MKSVSFHLPGLFEFDELYRLFLPLYRNHREYFYDWCEIGSIYGAPADCIWGGGRVGFGDEDPAAAIAMLREYGISPRLTFSNSLLTKEHLADRKCNRLCRQVSEMCAETGIAGGVIIHSDLLGEYLQEYYPDLYLVSSTTKVLTEYRDLVDELNRPEFAYVVPDFRLNKKYDCLEELTEAQKEKIEFLCNECCDYGCSERKACYENVSRKCLGLSVLDHRCSSENGFAGYSFARAMENPGFISVDDIVTRYAPMGFGNFKIEGRGLGSAMILEFLLYYMVKPEYHIHVREALYLDGMLDLF